jgi:hypothetical protein
LEFPLGKIRPRQVLLNQPLSVIVWHADFEPVRMCCKTGVTLRRRLRHVLGGIGDSTPDPEFHRLLVGRGMRTVASCAENLGEEE